MNLRTYTASTRRLQDAYRALDAAVGAAPYDAKLQIAATMDRLRAMPELLRVQACRKCDAHGRHYVTDSSWTVCQHPDVPEVDLRAEQASS